MTTEEILKLIDECKKRGVMQLKFSGSGAGFEFTLFPSLPQIETDPMADLAKPLDPSECQKCGAPADGRIAGFCRRHSLSEAGVTS